MAVDVSKIPNNSKFDPVREAILKLQKDVQEGVSGVATVNSSDGNIIITNSGNITVGTVNETITIGIDDSTYLTSSDISDFITLTDLSVTTSATPSGGGALSYDDTTGVFTFTPADAGTGLTLQQVTANGNTTTYGISTGNISVQPAGTGNGVVAISANSVGNASVTLTPGSTAGDGVISTTIERAISFRPFNTEKVVIASDGNMNVYEKLAVGKTTAASTYHLEVDGTALANNFITSMTASGTTYTGTFSQYYNALQIRTATGGTISLGGSGPLSVQNNVAIKDGDLDVNGDVTADFFIGDGSQLTNISTSDTLQDVTDNGATTDNTISIIKANVGVPTANGVYTSFLVESTDTHLDLISSAAGSWGTSINLVEGSSSTANANVWSIARRTTTGNGGLYFNYGTNNEHTNTTQVIFSTTGNIIASGTISGNGSGLTNVDAETLDGLDSTSFLRSDADDYTTSKLGVKTSNPTAALEVFGTDGWTSPSYYKHAYVQNQGRGLAVVGNESVIDVIGQDLGNHSASIILRGANAGFSFINDATDDELKLRYFQANADGFSVHGTAVGTQNMTDIVQFKTDGDVVFTNKVGIGVTPNRQLNVVGQIGIDGAAGMLISSDSDTNKIYSRIANNDGTPHPFEIRMGSNNAFHIDTSSNIGLATNTPNARLDVNGTVALGNGSQAIASDADLTIRVGNEFAGLDFKSARTSGNIGGLRWYDSNNTMQTQLLVQVDGTLNYYDEIQGVSRLLIEGTSGDVTIGGTACIKMQEDHYINFRFDIEDNANSPQYILLCRNAGGNDVNGTIRMDRTSGLRHACFVDIIVSAGSSDLPVGGLRAFGTSEAGEPIYRLVTCTYSGDSYVALEITNPDLYYESSGAYFTGRIVSTGEKLLPKLASEVSSVTYFEANNRNDVDGMLAIKATTSPRLVLNDGTDRYTMRIDNANKLVFQSTNEFFIVEDGAAANSIRIDDIGNVGFGTDNPQGKFHSYINASRQVGHNVNGGDLSVISDNNSTPVMLIKGTGTADLLRVFDNTSQVFTIQDGGNVGIGTTSPSAKLHIDNPSGDADLILEGSSQTMRIDQNSIRTTTNSVIGIFVNNDSSKGLRILTNGNIGVGTTSPSQKLHVVGKGLFTDDIQLTQTNPRIDYDGGNNGALRFFSTSSNTERMRITSAGNVGIGTTSPSAKLEIYGTGNTLRLDSAANQSKTILFRNVGTATAEIKTDGNLKLWAEDAGRNIYFDTSSGTKMTVLSGGNVGIGTTSPLVKLETVGKVTFGDNFTSVAATSENIVNIIVGANGSGQSNGIAFYENPNGFGMKIGYDGTGSGAANALRIYSDSDGAIFTFQNGGNLGIQKTGPSYELDVAGTIRADGDIIAYSDARIKENVKTIDNALDKVTKLRGVSYNKIGEAEEKIGVIAQEIEKVLPQVVQEDDEGMKSVAYGNIVGVLIEAIKEQQKQIDELKARLDA